MMNIMIFQQKYSNQFKLIWYNRHISKKLCFFAQIQPNRHRASKIAIISLSAMRVDAFRELALLDNRREE